MACCIYAYHDFGRSLVVLMTLFVAQPQDGMDAGLVANSHGGLILQRWRKHKEIFQRH